MPKRRRLEIIESLVVKGIKKAREERGLTKVAVSRKAGLDPTMILRFEREEFHATLQSVLKLCDALDLDLGELIMKASDRVRSRD